MEKVGWITKRPVVNKYLKLIRSYDTQVHQGNLAGAQIVLTNILQNIRSDSSKNLLVEACRSIRVDVESLMKQNQ
jgi:hypothetical protein